MTFFHAHCPDFAITTQSPLSILDLLTSCAGKFTNEVTLAYSALFDPVEWSPLWTLEIELLKNKSWFPSSYVSC